MSEPEFWNVPNVAGLPTLTISRALELIGVNPNIGKGAALFRSGAPVQSIPDSTNTPMEFDELVYDELGFTSGPPFDRFTIPQTVCPIRKVQVQCHCEWASDVGPATRVVYSLFLTPLNQGASLPRNGYLLERLSFGSGDEDAMGVDVTSGHVPSDAQEGSPSTVPLIPFTVGDFFEMVVNQDAGVAASIVRSAASIVVLG